ncbi:S1 family peptidase, partial [Bosea sp. Root483D1]|uniref:S1 family peptidase n=1 Tax=Bosea sp. Root483D1 TaxID=1736544 RepID=UPI001910688D
MSGVWQQGIARVLFSEGADDALPAGAGAEVFGSAAGNSVGTGLLVLTPQYGPCLLTAAHVVNAALGWDLYSTISPATDALIAFDLPTKGGDRFYVGRVVDWSPPQDAQDRAEYPVSDIALLQVVQDQSEGGSPLPSDLHLHKPEDFVVLTDEDIDGLGLRCFGFSRSDGAFAEGKVRGVSGAGWLHLVGTDDHGDFVAPGFSGAPAFDVSRRSILGMVVSVDGDDGRRLAFLQSSRNLWRACPALARPYRGLKFFEEEDAGFFFGRDEFVQRMLEKAKSFPLLGVTAASGSGKSSAIRAGLVPKLKADNRTLVIAMRPLGNPWKELARGLLEASPSKLDVFQADDRADEMAGKLRQDSLKLEGYADVLLKATGTDRLVIFVDQFEELFTLSGHEREASHQVPEAQSVTPDFRDLMVATAQLKRSPRVQWIYALRGDFADRAFKHPRFTETVGDGNVMLADMTEEALREAVSRPAAALEVEFEGATATQSDLISRIVRDSGLTAGALPLMQHLLEQLWRKMRDRMLTHADYDELKGVKGALNAHAEAVHATLSLEDQRLAQRLFRRLVNVEENGEVTRRVASRGELDALDAGLWPVAERLAEEDSRLLTLRGPETAGAGPDQTGALRTVEVAHEALQRHWERLTDWANEDRQFLQWRRRLEQRMADQDAFLSGPSLQAALGWLEARRDDLTTQQRAHINASRQHQEEQEREKAQRQADLEHALAEAQTERKRATDLVQEKSGLLHQMRALLTLARRFAIAAACLAVLAFAAAGAAGWYWKDARAQAEIANDQR